jgi:hypothetical protein
MNMHIKFRFISVLTVLQLIQVFEVYGTTGTDGFYLHLFRVDIQRFKLRF